MKNKEQILQILNNTDGHMTAEQMYIYCRNSGIKISMATTYRILGSLVEEGKIRKVSVPGQPDLFDKTLLEHEHLICIKCGKVKDIHIKNFKKAITKEINEDIDSYDLCIRYTCPECKKKKK